MKENVFQYFHIFLGRRSSEQSTLSSAVSIYPYENMHRSDRKLSGLNFINYSHTLETGKVLPEPLTWITLNLFWPEPDITCNLNTWPGTWQVYLRKIQIYLKPYLICCRNSGWCRPIQSLTTFQVQVLLWIYSKYTNIHRYGNDKRLTKIEMRNSYGSIVGLHASISNPEK